MKTYKIYLLISFLLFYSPILFAQLNGISILDVKTGTITEVANIYDSPAYNPSFSNNGKKIAFDTYGGYKGIYITDLRSGNSYPLEGGLAGNDASWSPDGKSIVFDRYGYELHVIPSGGGSPQMITYGFDAEWNNSSRKIVYNGFGTLKTINIDGSGETVVSYFGGNPSWSPNGNHIAFTDGENLWVVDVDDEGNPLGAPYQITFDGPGVYNQQPTWSNNSKSLVFHSNRMTDNFDFDIWSINISNGSIKHMGGFPYIGDYDPSYSKNGQYVAFSTSGNAGQTMPRNIANATLTQNFPNPFKITTTINLEVEKSGKVQMLVYDQLGRLVDVVLNSNLEAGSHEVIWNPSKAGASLTSGSYTIRMITADGIQTMQVIYNPN